MAEMNLDVMDKNNVKKPLLKCKSYPHLSSGMKGNCCDDSNKTPLSIFILDQNLTDVV